MLSGKAGPHDLPCDATQRQAAKLRLRKRHLAVTASRTITAEQLHRARNEAAAAERRRIGEVLASLTAAGAIDGSEAEALVLVLTNPTTEADNAVERYTKQRGKDAAGVGAETAKLYQQTQRGERRC